MGVDPPDTGDGDDGREGETGRSGQERCGPTEGREEGAPKGFDGRDKGGQRAQEQVARKVMVVWYKGDRGITWVDTLLGGTGSGGVRL